MSRMSIFRMLGLNFSGWTGEPVARLRMWALCQKLLKAAPRELSIYLELSDSQTCQIYPKLPKEQLNEERQKRCHDRFVHVGYESMLNPAKPSHHGLLKNVLLSSLAQWLNGYFYTRSPFTAMYNKARWSLSPTRLQTHCLLRWLSELSGSNCLLGGSKQAFDSESVTQSTDPSHLIPMTGACRFSAVISPLINCFGPSGYTPQHGHSVSPAVQLVHKFLAHFASRDGKIQGTGKSKAPILHTKLVPSLCVAKGSFL